MGGVSRRTEFADYRTMGIGVAIVPSVSVVIPAKNAACKLKHVFGTIETRIDYNGASASKSVIIKSGIKEPKWS